MSAPRTRETLASAGVSPADLCRVCGHPASEHGENLPSPCWHGTAPEVRHPVAITAEVMHRLETEGCRCIGFSPGFSRLVTVCSECRRASCWQGRFYCDKYREAGTVEVPVSELMALALEHPQYWRTEGE